MPQMVRPKSKMVSASPMFRRPLQRPSTTVEATRVAHQWKPRNVCVTVIDWGYVEKSVVVEASVLGVIAVSVTPSARPDEKGKWALWSLTTQCRVTLLLTEADAKRAGEVLASDARCLAALQLRDRLAVREALPKWVEPWCRACEKGGEFVDPKPFMEELR